MAIQYMMARDGEAPAILRRLNGHGVPGYGLLVAMLVPAVLLLVFPDLTQLAGLYSVGVVAAITINLLSTGVTAQFELRSWERWLLVTVGCLMACILLTLLWNKPNARAFSLAILVIGLAGRIVQAAAQFDASRVYMQLPTRVGMTRFFNGDVIGRVAEQLPVTRELVIRA
jgi:L-asparagine transporter-like permease